MTGEVDPVPPERGGPRDAWARLTPYEVGVPGREFADRTFGAIREEAEGRGTNLRDPGAFILLGEVGRALREIQGEERGGEAIHRYGAFLFHAFHFHGAGEFLLLAETAATRYLVEGSPVPETWRGELPREAGYLQLPRHLFWAKPEAGDEAPAEPLDGIFWTKSVGNTLSLLVALGVRGDRPGLSVIELPPVPLADAPRWVSESARDEGEDFETTLPGGELERLYSVATLGEALKLTGRALGYLAITPEALGEEERAPHPREAEEAGAQPLPSLLPFRRLRLVGGGAVESDREGA